MRNYRMILGGIVATAAMARISDERAAEIEAENAERRRAAARRAAQLNRTPPEEPVREDYPSRQAFRQARRAWEGK